MPEACLQTMGALEFGVALAGEDVRYGTSRWWEGGQSAKNRRYGTVDIALRRVVNFQN